MTRTLRTLRAALAAALFVGCGSENGLPDGGRSYPLELYTTNEDGGLTPMGDDTPLELRVGFQGFVFGRVALELPASAPPLESARLSLRIEGEPATRQNISYLEYQRACPDCATQRTPPFLIFANDVAPRAVTGRRYQLEADLFDARGHASARVSGTIRWDPSCIERADGSCATADAGAD